MYLLLTAGLTLETNLFDIRSDLGLAQISGRIPVGHIISREFRFVPLLSPFLLPQILCR